jgi:iron complex outermembrane receptor protein
MAKAATLLLLGLGLVCVAAPGFAQQPDSAAQALKALTIEQLMNLEVTSVSRRPERLAQTASAIQVITSEDIRRSGASSLPEALRLASNLQVAQVDSRQWAISARGFNSTTANKLLVLVDARTIYTPLFSGVFWDAQHVVLADIDRIEVISGPGATLWGANAVNGVINVITKDAKATPGLFLSAGGGTELRGFGTARYGGALGANVRYRIYATGFDRDPTALPNGQDATDDWHLGQGGFRADWDPSMASHVTLQGDFYDGRIGQTSGGDIAVHGGDIPRHHGAQGRRGEPTHPTARAPNVRRRGEGATRHPTHLRELQTHSERRGRVGGGGVLRPRAHQRRVQPRALSRLREEDLDLAPWRRRSPRLYSPLLPE